LLLSALRRTPTERARSLSDGASYFEIAKKNSLKMKLDETIRILNDAGVEFVIIGGVAMGLQGSAHLTRDIDFCYARTVKNMERLSRPLHHIIRPCAAHRRACRFSLMPRQLRVDLTSL